MDENNRNVCNRITQNVDAGEIMAQSSYSIVGMSCKSARQMADDIAGMMISDFIKNLQ